MRKRIAFISEHASPLAKPGSVDSGGQNVYVAELCKQLVPLGYDVDVYTRKESALQPDMVQWLPGVRVIHVVAGPERILPKESLLPYMTAFTQNMCAFIRKHQLQYTLLHAHFFMSGWVASKLKKILHIPYVITFHALGLIRRLHQKEADKFPPQRCMIEKFIVQDADTIIAECPQDEEDLLQHYDADPAKVIVIPCGFSCDEFEPIPQKAARKKLGLDFNEKILLQLGRMVPRKGVDNVIRSVAHLKEQHPNVKLVVVGGDTDVPDFTNPEMARLQQVAASADVLPNIHFAGGKPRDLLKYYYSASDVFVTTPWYEPFGITPLEAMACGTPVIGANVGGIKYTVKDGVNGFLVPPHAPQQVATKAAILFRNPQLLSLMQQNALQWVHQEFTWSHVAGKMALIYEDVALRHAQRNWVIQLHARERAFATIASAK